MRIGRVYAAHKRSVEVFFSQSMPSAAQATYVASDQSRRNQPLRRRDREETPFAGHALELMSTALLELEPRPDHQAAQRAGHEHVARPCPPYA